MCKSSKKTETTDVPGYVTEAGTDLAAKSSEVLNKPFEGYTAPRVADFTGDQQTAFQKLRDMISNAPQVGGAAIKGADCGSAPSNKTCPCGEVTRTALSPSTPT